MISKLTINILNIRQMTRSPASTKLEPRHSPIYLGRRFFQIAQAAAAEAHTDIGLTPLEFGVLIQLHDRPGVDQNTLADRLALDRTTTSAIVFRLEQLQLIERAVNDTDRRARILRLAPAGVALHDEHRPKAQAAQQRVLAVLTAAERKLLADLLTRVIDANQQYVQPGTIRRRRPRVDAAASK
jgi:MarR family transcriptional regulator, lower aerobic nicotinate degradation pathway regulator